MVNPVYSPSPSRYESGIRFRRCGRSGVRLPEISLGLWHNFGDKTPLENSLQMAYYAFDHGIVHFDLANNYGPSYGSAEETFGVIMKKSFAPFRDELFISTKAGYDMWPGPYGEWGSRKYLISSLDQSLRRMNLDYVDLFYSHRFDPQTPLEETLQALVDIVRSGKALYVGLSNYPPEAAGFSYNYLRERDVPCLLYQDRLNIIDRTPMSTGLVDLCGESGTGFIAFSPLQQGLLTSRYLSGVPDGSRMAQGKFLKREVLTPEMLTALRGLNDLALQRGQSLAGMALSWLLRDERVVSVIIGASSVSQIEDNLRSMDNMSFSDEELMSIEALSVAIQMHHL